MDKSDWTFIWSSELTLQALATDCLTRTSHQPRHYLHGNSVSDRRGNLVVSDRWDGESSTKMVASVRSLLNAVISTLKLI